MRSYVWYPTSSTTSAASTGDYINYAPISVASQSASPLRVEYDTPWVSWNDREERIIDELNRLWPDIIDRLENQPRTAIDRVDAAPEPEPELPELDAFLESLRAPTENA